MSGVPFKPIEELVGKLKSAGGISITDEKKIKKPGARSWRLYQKDEEWSLRLENEELVFLKVTKDRNWFGKVSTRSPERRIPCKNLAAVFESSKVKGKGAIVLISALHTSGERGIRIHCWRFSIDKKYSSKDFVTFLRARAKFDNKTLTNIVPTHGVALTEDALTFVGDVTDLKPGAAGASSDHANYAIIIDLVAVKADHVAVLRMIGNIGGTAAYVAPVFTLLSVIISTYESVQNIKSGFIALLGRWGGIKGYLKEEDMLERHILDLAEDFFLASGLKKAWASKDFENNLTRFKELMDKAVQENILVTVVEIKRDTTEIKDKCDEIIENMGKDTHKWKWQYPKEVPMLHSVGRQEELEDLHRRMSSGGKNAALLGSPGFGKTTLAALYADKYRAHYPGGILWLDVGDQRRTAKDAVPILRNMVELGYGVGVRSQKMEYAPGEVRSLLSCDPENSANRSKGPLLVIFDNIWSGYVLAELIKALPEDSSIILTTRDHDVAYALQEADRAIQTVKELSIDDAVKLLQTKATGLDDKTAKTVARGLGYHPQALVLAARALSKRKAEGYEGTAKELLRRVENGTGFGDLPRLDKANQNTNVEVALKYSYDYLGEQFQLQFRALGVFAFEAAFSSTAVAAVWKVDESAATDYMQMLVELSLAIVIDGGTGKGIRWQQHAIIRGYALRLQTDADKLLQWPTRHANYYIKFWLWLPLFRPINWNDGLQVQHAFDYCQRCRPEGVMPLKQLDELHTFFKSSMDIEKKVVEAKKKNNDLTGPIPHEMGLLTPAGLTEFELLFARFPEGHNFTNCADFQAQHASIMER